MPRTDTSVAAGAATCARRCCADPELAQTPSSVGTVTYRSGRRPAEQGDADAQFALGDMYASGRGVPQDDVEAHMWTDLAVARSSGEDRDFYAAKMTAEQVVEAQRLAREWKPTPVP